MPAPPFDVLSLNLAHGRGRGWHQALVSRETIEANLQAVAQVITRENPDIVGLQEADGASIWSGRFDHVEYLTQSTELTYSFRGDHVSVMRLSYGTALASRWPIENAVSHRFLVRHPATPKGLVHGTVRVGDGAELEIDVASVHLDFARRRARRHQAEQIVANLTGRQRPLVLMGDFNCTARDERDALRYLAEQLDLQAWRPEAIGMGTFPLRQARLDWILISRELEFVEYRTLPDPLSDHLAVQARLQLA